MKMNVIFFINNVINKRSKIESTASFVSDRQSLTNTTFSTKIDLQNKRNPLKCLYQLSISSAIDGLACNNYQYIHI